MEIGFVGSIEEITPEIAEGIRAGRFAATVTTRKSRRGYHVARREHRTVYLGRAGGMASRRVESEYKLEAYSLSQGKWQRLTDELARAIDPEEFARRHEARERRKAKAREAANELEVGDILASSWGWEQTNVEFYEVVAKSARYVTVREIRRDYDETGFMSGTVTPRPGEFVTGYSHIEDNERGKRCRVGAGGTVRINDVVSAWKWNGKPQYVSSYA